MLLVSSEGTIERCNQAFCLLANTPPEAIIGRSLSETRGAAPLDQEVFFAMARTRRRESTERQAGSEWFSTTADPVLNSTGEFTGGVIIISNITVRKRLEEAQEREQELLHQETERLEAKVLERTRQLQDSVSTMEGFCYTIAHDLRAPLRAVNGFTATLLEHYSPTFDEDGKALAGRITAATKRMDQLIQELLAFGRLSSTELPRWTVDLGGTVRAAVAQCSADIKEKQAAVEIIEPLPSVWANATIVEQIVVNLLTNALKFVPPHVTPRVAVRADPQGERVRIWVEDNGSASIPPIITKSLAFLSGCTLIRITAAPALGWRLSAKQPSGWVAGPVWNRHPAVEAGSGWSFPLLTWSTGASPANRCSILRRRIRRPCSRRFAPSSSATPLSLRLFTWPESRAEPHLGQHRRCIAPRFQQVLYCFDVLVSVGWPDVYDESLYRRQVL